MQVKTQVSSLIMVLYLPALGVSYVLASDSRSGCSLFGQKPLA
jgi:hypothetical protein